MNHLRTKRLLLVGALALASAAITSGQASAATLTVCPSGCMFSQIAPAIAAASPGDTIQVAAGTYGGGFTIDKSLKLVGAGAGQTVISGGGPVITIGQIFAASEPTVSIDGVTITGGVTRSSPESVPFTGQAGVFTAGGGIEIPPNGDFSGGATVMISNSVITGNRVAPTGTVPFGPPCPGGSNCPFAGAFGGGIDNWGTLTLTNTTLSNNLIGSASGLSALASDAEGAGIRNWLDPLTITNSVISGNQAGAAAPNGRFADGGAILLTGGTLTMSNSSVMNNAATLAAEFPSSVDAGVAAGGMHLTRDVQAVTISNSTIVGNAATATNSVGDANASSGGLHIDINDSNNVTLSNDVIASNSVRAATLPGSTGNAEAGSGAGEITGTLSNLRITGNSVDASSEAGNAKAAGGATVFDGGTITSSLISDNHIHASAPLGSVVVRGGGVFVAVSLTLRNATVSANSVDASGESGSARGGGIYNVAFPDGPDGPPGGPLVLQNSNVTSNTLSGTAGILLQGGGIYLQNEPITLTNSVITQNIPDQCFGC
jgi:hypothetical protein